jgi:hypothetical protein
MATARTGIPRVVGLTLFTLVVDGLGRWSINSKESYARLFRASGEGQWQHHKDN